jgi:hypothetical protein
MEAASFWSRRRLRDGQVELLRALLRKLAISRCLAQQFLFEFWLLLRVGQLLEADGVLQIFGDHAHGATFPQAPEPVAVPIETQSYA